MTFLTRFGCRLAAPLAVAGLLAGCQSSRFAFQFAPAAPYAGTTQPVATLAAPAPAATSAALLTASRQPAAPPAPVRRAATRLALLPKPARASQPALAVLPASGPLTPAEAVVTPRSHQRHAAPAHTTESGLKRIFFFFLFVVLGVLAGLGALLSLIPGVSFFGGVGLAAAGLVVLFLLYRLLSGGSKQKAKAK